ncbi:MoaD/ThiS family protein [Desulfohalovibrio reitneri]|uniref:MoaD/ThiS family protein n=1 Tax=Desulfohalovibrio reitneri TaxID=1307759 RepID=UPI0004A6B680|nr:MoaD/ThiS family protein [Desulfohalovibrio reitneri]
MRIDITCFATLKKYEPKAPVGYETEAGTIGQLAGELGLPPEELKIIFINGAKASLDSELSEGDRVGLFPAVGGG